MYIKQLSHEVRLTVTNASKHVTNLPRVPTVKKYHFQEAHSKAKL